MPRLPKQTLWRVNCNFVVFASLSRRRIDENYDVSAQLCAMHCMPWNGEFSTSSSRCVKVEHLKHLHPNSNKKRSLHDPTHGDPPKRIRKQPLSSTEPVLLRSFYTSYKNKSNFQQHRFQHFEDLFILLITSTANNVRGAEFFYFSYVLELRKQS